MIKGSFVAFSLSALCFVSPLTASDATPKRSLHSYRMIKRPKKSGLPRVHDALPHQTPAEAAPVEEVAADPEPPAAMEETAVVEKSLEAPPTEEISVLTPELDVETEEVPIVEGGEAENPSHDQEVAHVPADEIADEAEALEEVTEIAESHEGKLDDEIALSLPVFTNHTHPVQSMSESRHRETGIVAEAGFLLLKAQEEGLDYGILSPINATFNEDIFGTKSRIKGDFDYALRFGVGYHLAEDGWTLLTQWFHFKDSYTSRSKIDTNKSFFPFWLGPTNNPDPDNAKAVWDLDFDLIDVELERRFYVGDYLALKPHAGIRAAFIHQKFDVTYYGVESLGNQPISSTIKSINQCNHDGLGIVLGLDSDYRISSGLSLYAKGSLALVYSNYDLDHRERFQDGSLRSHVKDNFDTMITNIEFGGGLSYAKFFENCKYYIRGSLGWEHHIWIHENQFMRPSSINQGPTMQNDRGNMSLSGLTTRLSFSF